MCRSGNFAQAACYLLIGCFHVFHNPLQAQDQKLADSLILLYESGEYPGSELELLLQIANEETQPEEKLAWSEALILKASEDSVLNYLYRGYLQKGNALQSIGDNVPALTSFLESLRFAQRMDDQRGIGSLMVAIADTYSALGNSANAMTYYNRGIAILRTVNDSVKIATSLLNAGDEYIKAGDLATALTHTLESERIFNDLKVPQGQAYSLGNLGMVYALQGDDERAIANINKAVSMLEEMQDYYPISVYLTYMSDIYRDKGDVATALDYSGRSLKLAMAYGLKEQISAASLSLSELYGTLGDTDASYRFYRNHIAYRDSVRNIASVEQMADLRTDYEVSRKQVEVDLLNQQRKTQRIIVIATAIALFLIAILAVGLYRRNKFIQKTKRIIEEEKNRSDTLLLNILPEETAMELREKGRVEAKKFDSVTVLFTDFKDFTKSAGAVAPEKLVESIDFYFKEFDAITSKYDLEKIKTIGDSYMCAGGLPTINADHAKRVAMAAREMIQVVHQESLAQNDRLHFEVRIGIHTGPVVAGIVGNKKWQYDIWGDTVNIASRMESNSLPGQINLSETTYQEIKSEFDCDYRGAIDVKNRGALKMYFLANPPPA